MMSLSDEKIKELSVKYVEKLRDNPKSEAFFETIETIDQILQKHPNQGIELVKCLIFLTKDEEELAYIAAAPLENLIDYHAESIQEALRILVRQTPIMRRAMKHVWHTDPMSMVK
ncbi:MAG: hypothetical protein GY915_07565 [bacterium]|nr:hypothetical protein [bacterium]